MTKILIFIVGKTGFSSFRILGGLVGFCSLEYILEGFLVWNIREFRGFYSLQYWNIGIL